MRNQTAYDLVAATKVINGSVVTNITVGSIVSSTPGGDYVEEYAANHGIDLTMWSGNYSYGHELE